MDYTVTQTQLLAYLRANGHGISRQTFSGSILPMMLRAGHARRVPWDSPKGTLFFSEAGKQGVLAYLKRRAETGGHSNGTYPGRKHNFEVYQRVTGGKA